MLPEIKKTDENLTIHYDKKFPESTECEAYFCEYDGIPKVIKIFKNESAIENKINKIKLLKERLIDVKEIVTADAIVYEENPIGYIMPYIDGQNLYYTRSLNKMGTLEYYKELSRILKKLHELNIVAADFGKNILYTPDKKIIFIDHDNFSIDNYKIDAENIHLLKYKEKIKTIDEKFDNYLLNIYTVAEFKRIVANAIYLAYDQSPKKFRFRDQDITNIFKNTMNLGTSYNEELIIDKLNTKEDLKKIKTRIL